MFQFPKIAGVYRSTSITLFPAAEAGGEHLKSTQCYPGNLGLDVPLVAYAACAPTC